MDITIEVVSRGHWGAKVRGTNTTLIRSWATLTVTPEGDPTNVVWEEDHAKGTDQIDDVCRRSWTVHVTENDPDAPPGFPPGDYVLESATGVRIRGR